MCEDTLFPSSPGAPHGLFTFPTSHTHLSQSCPASWNPLSTLTVGSLSLSPVPPTWECLGEICDLNLTSSHGCSLRTIQLRKLLCLPALFSVEQLEISSPHMALPFKNTCPFLQRVAETEPCLESGGGLSMF